MSDRFPGVNRREFLGAAAATGLALGVAPARATGLAASEKIAVGVVGLDRGLSVANTFAGLEGAEVAYVCDVDERRVTAAVKKISERQEKAPTAVRDFRRILDDKSVDAVAIATPDHWHAPMTILACQADKHVYVEKPCSHNPREGEWMVAVARQRNRVVQMGNQRRSREKIVEAIEVLRQGAIGRVYYSTGWYFNKRGVTGRATPAETPKWLDYELWQGPAPRRSFRDNLVHYKWHWFWHWGTGEIGNNGVHAIDLCRWGLGVDYPIRVSSAGGRYHFDDAQETPDTHVATFDFEGRKSIKFEGLSCNKHSAAGGFGVAFHGDGGTLVINGDGYTVYDLDDKEVRKVEGPGGDAVHLANFTDCIRSGKRPNSDIEGGHESTLLCHLGNIAHQVGRSLRCDPKNGHILDDSEASSYWGREYDERWKPRV